MLSLGCVTLGLWLAPLAPTTQYARCTAPQCQATAVSELGLALHESLSHPPSAKEANSRWLQLATLLCDGVCELAAEAAVAAEADAGPPAEEVLMAARELCSSVLERLAAESPAVYAVAKFSAKRNEGLRSRRGVERCLAELGLLLGTHAVLTSDEAEELLDELRPLTRTAASSARVAAFLVLCRGFGSPGAGSRGGWRTGRGTVQQLLAGAAPPPPLAEALEQEWLRRPGLREHSRAMRATLPFLETPLRLWLASLPPEERPAGAGADIAGAGARTLVLQLAGSGEEGRRLLRALQQWAIEGLLAAVGVGPEGEDGVSASVRARARGSEAAARGGEEPRPRLVCGLCC